MSHFEILLTDYLIKQNHRCLEYKWDYELNGNIVELEWNDGFERVGTENIYIEDILGWMDVQYNFKYFSK